MYGDQQSAGCWGATQSLAVAEIEQVCVLRAKAGLRRIIQKMQLGWQWGCVCKRNSPEYIPRGRSATRCVFSAGAQALRGPKKRGSR